MQYEETTLLMGKLDPVDIFLTNFMSVATLKFNGEHFRTLFSHFCWTLPIHRPIVMPLTCTKASSNAYPAKTQCWFISPSLKHRVITVGGTSQQQHTGSWMRGLKIHVRFIIVQIFTLLLVSSFNCTFKSPTLIFYDPA